MFLLLASDSGIILPPRRRCCKMVQFVILHSSCSVLTGTKGRHIWTSQTVILQDILCTMKFSSTFSSTFIYRKVSILINEFKNHLNLYRFFFFRLNYFFQFFYAYEVQSFCAFFISPNHLGQWNMTNFLVII